MGMWQDISFVDVCNEVCSGQHRHVVVLLGSAVSLGHRSNSLSVDQIRNDLVLKPLRELTTNSEVRRIVSRLLTHTKGQSLGPAEALCSCPLNSSWVASIWWMPRRGSG